MVTKDKDAQELRYDIVRSSSSSLVSATNKLTTWVNMKIELGWTPLGSPILDKDEEKYHILQTLTKL
ncbi:hypothetical protein N8653_02960 [Euryarchaeota archaeon]|jgi:hypothetical protein|nr:hypothetical protein [Euryarchaeota archaeon]